jgi:hypothetical protein
MAQFVAGGLRRPQSCWGAGELPDCYADPDGSRTLYLEEEFAAAASGLARGGPFGQLQK